MTNAELKELIQELVMDEDTLDQIIVLEGDEFADGAIGITNDDRVVYSYDKLVQSLMQHNSWSMEEAIEWLDYNTLRSLPYMENDGNAPIIIMNMFEDYKIDTPAKE